MAVMALVTLARRGRVLKCIIDVDHGIMLALGASIRQHIMHYDVANSFVITEF